MTRSSGMISMQLLSGFIQELRVKLNIEIVKFADNAHRKTASSLGDFKYVDRENIIGATASMIQTYTTIDTELPRQVQKEHAKILKDFSLLHPIKLLEALDPRVFELEERQKQLDNQISRAKKQGVVMHKVSEHLYSKVNRDHSFVTARFIHDSQN